MARMAVYVDEDGNRYNEAGQPIKLSVVASLSERFQHALSGVKSATNSPVALVSPWLAQLTWLVSRAYYAIAKQAYGGNAVVNAVGRMVATAVSEPPIVPYTVTSSFKKEELPYNDDLYQLLRAPNPLLTTFEFVELVVIHAICAGRSYWWKERDQRNKVKAIWPLRPDRVGPIYANQPAQAYGGASVPAPYQQVNTLVGSDKPLLADQRVLAGWTYWQPGYGSPTRIPANDVMAIIIPDPAGETGGLVEGLGPLQVLSREIEADNEATSLVAALLKNNAMPGSLLSIKSNVARDKVAAIKREFKRAFGGNNRGDVAVIDGETMYHQLGFNMQELEFPNLRKVSEARIASALGIPPVLAGLTVGIDSANRSTLAEFREFFAETTCTNWWKRIQEAITRDLASEFGSNLVCEFDTSRVKSLIQQSNRQIQPFYQAAQLGVVTIDEYRVNVLNLDPLPNGAGNVLLVPSMLSPMAIGSTASEGDAWNSLRDTDEDPSGDRYSNVRRADGTVPTGARLAKENAKSRTPRNVIEAGKHSKVVRIQEVRKHIGERGKSWIAPIEWRSFIYEEEDAA